MRETFIARMFGKFKRMQKGRLFISEGPNPINFAMRSLMMEDYIANPFDEEIDRSAPSWFRRKLCEVFPSQFGDSSLEFIDLEKTYKTNSTFELSLTLDRVKFKRREG